MPPCLYICCHFEISDEHHGSPSRPKATSKAVQDGRRVSRRHSHHREVHRERSRERQRHHTHRHSRSTSRDHQQAPNSSSSTPQKTTTTLDLQDHSPTQQVTLLRHRIESEDALHSHRMTTLQKTLHSEHQRHSTRALTFRERLIDLGTKQRDRLRTSPKKLSPTKSKAIVVRDGELGGGRQQKGSHVARWLEGLVSVSSISGIRESSDGSSSVEVVAAKDAKGKGKGIRIVSDAVEETAAVVDKDVERHV
ncbi:hypothetical protein AUEXF2481DRAFT_40967 [Aureobasidium subglaciale EXF-2481]|uniref:Uncharacterized protein n=1 Tax=Aureobasidium subglaciale (strain EXF-2481) TaxID=1043005 RepID=A0A074Z5Z6_AURSE|nr:uncharacterized protein AUEXF2481DRAFT_40967 [Aureobasidium subglaciale EXF-2481]KEQ94381.1 hypothetical protein AUEXF2481DRAFT_40967 [Aureobasidium subglaciale EXF-2481]